MPKVTKDGIFAKKYNLPQIPPAGLKAICRHCLAELITEKREIGAKIFIKKNRATNIFSIGWRILCPQCEKNVFFRYEDLSTNLLFRLNGWGKNKE
jgi:hypothetical protein